LIPYFDENMGDRIPRALKLLGLQAIPGVSKRYGGGQVDTAYLKRAAQRGWLAISANKHMLDVEAERDTILREHVGIVFITDGQMTRPALMLLLLRKWEWFAAIDNEEVRPFVFYLYPSGRTRRLALS
jgi:hypothetical protein